MSVTPLENDFIEMTARWQAERGMSDIEVAIACAGIVSGIYRDDPEIQDLAVAFARAIGKRIGFGDRSLRRH